MKMDGRRMKSGSTRAAALVTVAIVLCAGGRAWAQGRRVERHRRVVAAACVPGAQVACACRGGADGVQVCEDDGARFRPCECDADGASEASARAPEPPPSTLAASPFMGARGPATPWTSRAAPSAAPVGRWYGWQILLCDVAAEGFGVAALASHSVALLVPSGAIHVLGGPIVHWAHGNVGRGFASLGLRLVLPTAGALIGVAAKSGSAAAIGGGIGGLLAIVLDVSVLARDTRPAALSNARAPVVFASVTPQGAAVGVAGSF